MRTYIHTYIKKLFKHASVNYDLKVDSHEGCEVRKNKQRKKEKLYCKDAMRRANFIYFILRVKLIILASNWLRMYHVIVEKFHCVTGNSPVNNKST